MTKTICYVLSAFVGLFLLGMVCLLSTQAFSNLFSGVSSILTAPIWNYRQEMFGAFSLIFGTLMVAAIALAIAIPVGLMSAVFLSEFLSGKSRAVSKIIIELLAGVPSIVIGLLGVMYLRDWLAPLHTAIGSPTPDSLFTAGVLLSLMVLPTIASLSDDVLRCIPKGQREAAYGLGLTRVQAIGKVLLPQAKRGLFGVALLAIGRALGETIAVFLVVGRADRPFQFSELGFRSLFQAGQTITSKLGGSEIAIAYGDTTHWPALMALAFLLWASVAISAYASSFLMNRRLSA